MLFKLGLGLRVNFAEVLKTLTQGYTGVSMLVRFVLNSCLLAYAVLDDCEDFLVAEGLQLEPYFLAHLKGHSGIVE